MLASIIVSYSYDVIRRLDTTNNQKRKFSLFFSLQLNTKSRFSPFDSAKLTRIRNSSLRAGRRHFFVFVYISSDSLRLLVVLLHLFLIASGTLDIDACFILLTDRAAAALSHSYQTTYEIYTDLAAR